MGTGFAKELCQCDMVAAKCFRRARSTYNAANRRMYGFDYEHCKKDNHILGLTLWKGGLF